MFPTRAFITDTTDALQRDVSAFLPELVLCGTIVGLLLARFVPDTRRMHAAVLALLGTIAALVVAVGFWPGTGGWDNMVPGSGKLSGFSGLLAFDLFGLYVRVFLLAFLALALWLSLLTGIPDREDSADFVTLLARRHARHDADGVGQPPAHGVHRRRDGEPAELRPGRVPEGQAAGRARRR